MPIHGSIKGTDEFRFRNAQFSASSRKSAALRGGVLVCAAQAMSPIEADLFRSRRGFAEKGHLWTETDD